MIVDLHRKSVYELIRELPDVDHLVAHLEYYYPESKLTTETKEFALLVRKYTDDLHERKNRLYNGWRAIAKYLDGDIDETSFKTEIKEYEKTYKDKH